MPTMFNPEANVAEPRKRTAGPDNRRQIFQLPCVKKRPQVSEPAALTVFSDWNGGFAHQGAASRSRERPRQPIMSSQGLRRAEYRACGFGHGGRER